MTYEIKGSDSSLFLDVIGESPRNKILEFFIEGRETDYPIKYLADELNLNRSTLYKSMKELISNQLLIFSRKIGSSKFFKLNTSSAIVLSLIEIFDKTIDEKINEYIEKEKLESESIYPRLTDQVLDFNAEKYLPEPINKTYENKLVDPISVA